MLLIGLIACAVLVADLLSKHWVAAHLVPGQSVPVLPGVLWLNYVRNSGAAFGLLQGQTFLFVVIAVAVVTLILTWGLRAARGVPLLALAFGLQLGGALGNLVDRLLYGQVIDFIQIRGFPFVFNVADMAITVGGALFALLVLREPAPQGPGGQ